MGLFDDEYYGGSGSRRGFSEYGSRRSRRRSGGYNGSDRRSGGLSNAAVSAVLASLFTALLLCGLFAVLVLPRLNGTAFTALSASDPYDRIVQAAAAVRPSVVSIVNHRTAGEVMAENAALGSGVIFQKQDGKAYVITNDHVIAGAEELEAVLIDGTRLKAAVVGTDVITDVAVLEIEGGKVKSIAKVGDSDRLDLGETVIALGNPLGLGDTLTSGIVSYPKRVMPVSLNEDGVYDWEQQVIQTDAAINEGNSGGALVDLDGRLIGINTMKIASTGVEGIGFAIPINQVIETAEELVRSGRISRPYLGVYSLDLNNPYAPMAEDQLSDLKLPKGIEKGVVVLESLGPAKEAGIKLNDVIVGFDNHSIDSTLMLRKYLYGYKRIGDKMKISYYRDGKKQSVTVTLGERPQAGEQ